MARGPAYPFLDLETAVGLLGKLHGFAKRGAASVEAAVKEAWGWSPTSSTPVKVLAALKYFGLIEDAGKDHKSIKITDRGYRILVDSADSPDRVQALKDAALSPSQYAHCYREWGADLPPAARSALIFERGFVPSTVDGFIKDYKKTIAYAGLDGGQVDDEVRLTDNTSTGAKTGVTSSESTAVTNKQAATPPLGSPPSRVAPEGPAMRQDVFSIEEGAVTIQWPAALSKESLQDIEDWLEIIKRKIARSLKAEGGDDLV